MDGNTDCTVLSQRDSNTPEAACVGRNGGTDAVEDPDHRGRTSSRFRQVQTVRQAIDVLAQIDVDDALLRTDLDVGTDIDQRGGVRTGSILVGQMTIAGE